MMEKKECLGVGNGHGKGKNGKQKSLLNKKVRVRKKGAKIQAPGLDSNVKKGTYNSGERRHDKKGDIKRKETS